MVVPIRDIGNKSLFTLAFHSLSSNMTSSSDMNIVINSEVIVTTSIR